MAAEGEPSTADSSELSQVTDSTAAPPDRSSAGPSTGRSDSQLHLQSMAAAGQPPNQGNELFSSRIVTVLVGPEEIAFKVHQAIFDRPEAGKFFNRVFTNGFQETVEGVLRLPEDKPKLVGRFINMLYGSSTHPIPESLPPRNRHMYFGERGCLRVYSFAHKYLSYELQDSMVSEVYHYRYGWPEMLRGMQHFVNNVPEPSHMHTLLAKKLALAIVGNLHNDRLSIDVIPEELRLLVLKQMRSAAFAWFSPGRLDDIEPAYLGPECDYHVHDAGMNCEKQW